MGGLPSWFESLALFLLAASPLLSLLGLLVVLRLPAKQAMPMALLLCAALAFGFWGMPLGVLGMALYSGLGLALQILAILAGALLWLRFLRLSGALSALVILLQPLRQYHQPQPHLGPSPILTLIIPWLLLAFLEGAAGFGTPAIILASLLLALGYPPVLALALVLIGGNSAVSFGALATPLWLGLASAWPQMTEVGLRALAWRLSLQELALTPLVPLLLVVTHLLYFRAWHLAWPWLMVALGLGLGYAGLALGVHALLGMEYVSLVTPLLLLLIWFGLMYMPGLLRVAGSALGPALGPWCWLLLALLLWRAPWWPWSDWLQGQQLAWPPAVDAKWQLGLRWLMLPAWPLMLVTLVLAWQKGCLAALWQRQDARHPSLWSGLLPSGLAVLMAVPLMRIFALSGHNQAQLPSMADHLAQALASFPLPWLMPALLGALGSSSAGSATYGHLLMVPLQLSLAEQLAWSTQAILVIQLMAANAGNMLNLPLLLSLCAAYGCRGQEFRVLAWVLPSFVCYLLLIAAHACFLLAF